MVGTDFSTDFNRSFCTNSNGRHLKSFFKLYNSEFIDASTLASFGLYIKFHKRKKLVVKKYVEPSYNEGTPKIQKKRILHI